MKRTLLSLLCMVLCTVLAAQRITHVSGRVTSGSQPVADCWVKEIDKANRVIHTAQTDVNGMFTISISNSRANRLMFSADGLGSQIIDITREVVRINLEARLQKKTTTQVEAVDLGLNVKWADRNVGANAPHEFGAYLSWGETEEKDDYYWSSTENYDKCLNYTKYDAAATLWRERWQMPTNTDAVELITRCLWTWCTEEGVPGFRVTGPSGNSIFLPAGGYRDGMELKDENVCGSYWTASPYEGMTDCAYGLQLSEHQLYRGHRTRAFGFLVRPVWK